MSAREWRPASQSDFLCVPGGVDADVQLLGYFLRLRWTSGAATSASLRQAKRFIIASMGGGSGSFYAA